MSMTFCRGVFAAGLMTALVAGVLGYPPGPKKRAFTPTIFKAAIAPDNQFVLLTYMHHYHAASLMHSELVLLDARDGKELLKMAYINQPTVFLPGGKQLLSGGIGSFPWPGNPPPPALEFIDQKKGQVLNKIAMPTKTRLHALAASPDGTAALTAFDDSRIMLWDLSSGKKIRDLGPSVIRNEASETTTTAIFFTPDGKKAFTHTGGLLRAWNVATGQAAEPAFPEYAELRFHHWWLGQSSEVKLGCSGRLGGERKEPMLAVWDLETGKRRHFLKGHTDYLVCAGFAEAGKTLISVSVDKSVREWDLKSGTEEYSYKLAYLPTAGCISSDGRFAFLATQDGAAEFRDLQKRKVLWTLPARAPKKNFPFGN